MSWRRWWRRQGWSASGRVVRAPTAEDEADDWALGRQRMVEDQLERRGVRDPVILAAFRRVPRHLFVESEDPYGDRALSIPAGQTISQPYVVAAMTALARPPAGFAGSRVLEIGTGSGYAAAILAALGAEVTSVERHEPLAAWARDRLARAGFAEVEVVVGDGSLGWPPGAPYDAILVTAAGPTIPEPLKEQLAEDGGRLVMPVGSRDQQWLTLVVRDGGRYTTRADEPVVFVPLLGEHGFRP